MITTTQAPSSPPIDWLAKTLAAAQAAPETATRNALVPIACDVRRIADAMTEPTQAPAVDLGWREYTPGEA